MQSGSMRGRAADCFEGFRSRSFASVRFVGHGGARTHQLASKATGVVDNNYHHVLVKYEVRAVTMEGSVEACFDACAKQRNLSSAQRNRHVRDFLLLEAQDHT